MTRWEQRRATQESYVKEYELFREKEQHKQRMLETSEITAEEYQNWRRQVYIKAREVSDNRWSLGQDNIPRPDFNYRNGKLLNWHYYAINPTDEYLLVIEEKELANGPEIEMSYSALRHAVYQGRDKDEIVKQVLLLIDGH